MSDWPSTLPQAPEPQGYTNIERNNVIRTGMGYGPDKLRQNNTQVIRDVSMQFFLENSDADTLDDFYINTLSRVDSFTWKDHRTDNVSLYRFKSPPSFVPFGTALWWDISLQLEILEDYGYKIGEGAGAIGAQRATVSGDGEVTSEEPITGTGTPASQLAVVSGVGVLNAILDPFDNQPITDPETGEYITEP